VNAYRIASYAATLCALVAVCEDVASQESCLRNHYILDYPCGVQAPDVGIGAVGAVAADMNGSVYFSSPNIVSKLDVAGRLTRVAGNGTPGYSGDGGPAVTALLNNMPFDSYPEAAQDPIDYSPLVGGLATDPAGNVYIADAYNNRVRKVDTSGIITTVPGAEHISWPQGVAADGAGALYVASVWGPVLKVASSGAISALAGYNCGPGYLLPGVCGPEGIALATDGGLYVADGYCRVRKISPGETFFNEAIFTVAGDDASFNAFDCGHTLDTGPATTVALAWPYGVAVDNSGNLVIADTYNHCIRKVDAAGNIATVAGTCGTRGFSGDGGTATSALLDTPYGVAADSFGNLFIADTLNQRIRKVSPDGTITTVAGNGGAVSLDLPVDSISGQREGRPVGPGSGRN
jgi:sugar lactone lactonase YvrE